MEDRAPYFTLYKPLLQCMYCTLEDNPKPVVCWYAGFLSKTSLALDPVQTQPTIKSLISGSEMYSQEHYIPPPKYKEDSPVPSLFFIDF